MTRTRHVQLIFFAALSLALTSCAHAQEAIVDIAEGKGFGDAIEQGMAHPEQDTIAGSAEGEEASDAIEENIAPAEQDTIAGSAEGEEAIETTEQNIVPPKREAIAGSAKGTRRVPKLSIPVPKNNSLVGKYKKQYESENGREYLSAIMKRSAPYRSFILAEADRLGAPDFLLYLPVIESAFSEKAVSKAGAVGIWQFMKNSVGGYGLRIDEWLDERRDPWLSSTAALRKLMENYNYFGDWCLALAAYNCGVGAVSKAVKRAGTSNYWELCRQGYLPKETINYVPKFLAVAQILSESEKLGIDWGEASAVDDFTTLTVEKSVDINMVAARVGENSALLAKLNPALHYSVTPPDAEYALRIPSEKKEIVMAVLASNEPLIQYYVYKIRAGDTLYALSLHYGVSVDMIAESNPGIRAEALRIGSTILIPALNEVDAYPGKGGGSQLDFSREYIVKRGDTLWSIALAYNIQIETLAEKNNLDVNGVLASGKILKVPAY